MTYTQKVAIKIVKKCFFYFGWIVGTYIMINKAAHLQIYFRQKYYFGRSSVYQSGIEIYYLMDVLTPVILMIILVAALALFFLYGQRHVTSYLDIWLDFITLGLYAISILGGYSNSIRSYFAKKSIALPLETLIYCQYFSGLLLGGALLILFWRIYQKKSKG